MKAPSFSLLTKQSLQQPYSPRRFYCLRVAQACRYGSSPTNSLHVSRRLLSTTLPSQRTTGAKHADRGPTSNENTQTDFGALNVLGNTPPPSTSIDACLTDGFHLDNGVKITGGSGCLLVAGEAFSWRPWYIGGSSDPQGRGRMLNANGQWVVPNEAWGVFDLMWPKPGTRPSPGA